MNDDRALRILEEIRDLQRENVANYQEALRNQHESIRLQQASLRRVRVIMAVATAALILAVGMLVMLLLRESRSARHNGDVSVGCPPA